MRQILLYFKFRYFSGVGHGLSKQGAPTHSGQFVFPAHNPDIDIHHSIDNQPRRTTQKGSKKVGVLSTSTR